MILFFSWVVPDQVCNFDKGKASRATHIGLVLLRVERKKSDEDWLHSPTTSRLPSSIAIELILPKPELGLITTELGLLKTEFSLDSRAVVNERWVDLSSIHANQHNVNMIFKLLTWLRAYHSPIQKFACLNVA